MEDNRVLDTVRQEDEGDISLPEPAPPDGASYPWYKIYKLIVGELSPGHCVHLSEHTFNAYLFSIGINRYKSW